MDLSPILARLKSQLTGFRVIGGAADLDALGNSLAPPPACYLLPLSETAEENGLLGGFEQRLTISFMVALAVSNKRDVRGEAALAELPARRSQIKAALLAWAPDPAVGEPVRFAGGHLMKFEDGLLWWADEFRVTTYQRSV